MDAKKLKSLVKKNVGEKPTFGTNPRDPWSAKSDIAEDTINETPLLNRYLKSRGINPEFATKDQKVAHSKTQQFKKWMNDHMNDRVVESMTTEPTITQKKSGALKTSANKQKEIKTPHGPGTHNEDVNVCEECNQDPCACSHGFSQQIDEISKQTLTGYVHSAISDRNKTDAKMMDASAKNSKEFSKRRHSNITKLLDKSNKRSAGIGKALDRLNKEETEQIDELDKSTVKSYKAKATLRQVGHASNIYDREVEGGKKPDPEVHRKLNKVKAGIARANARLGESNLAEADKHSMIGKILRGHELRKKVDKSFDSWGAAQKTGDKKKASKAFRDHERYTNLERPGTWTKVDEQGVAEGSQPNDIAVYHHTGPDADKKAQANAKKLGSEYGHFRHDMADKYDNLHVVTQKRYFPDYAKKQGVSEAKEANYGGDYQSSVHALKAKAEKKPVDMKSLAARMQASYRRDNEANKTKAVSAMKESQLEPMAACNQPWDGANSPDDTIKAKRGVKLIQDLAKKKSIKEDMYDHEKEDKSVSGPAKKPKVQKVGMDDNTKEAPQAAAVMKGGKTLTGEPRDTIEIDPMMKMRRQAGNSQNAENEKNSQKNN